MQLHDAQFGGRISAQALAGEVGAYVEMDNLQVFADIFTIGTGMPSIDVAAAAPPDLHRNASGQCTHASAGFAFAAIAMNLTP